MFGRTSLLFLCAFAAPAQTQPQFGPPGQIGPQKGFFRLSANTGPRVHFDAHLEPPLSNPDELKLGWGVFQSTDGNREVWHRFVIDEVHKKYFGYDLTLTALLGEPLAFPPVFTSYRVAFSPLTTQPDQLPSSDLTPAPLPKYPEPQTIMPGDKISLDLLVSPDGKRKIVDYIDIAPPGPIDPPPATNDALPKDYTLDDGPIRYDFAGYVAINGEKFQGPTSFLRSQDGGATLWFCFPGQPGRYILSLAPRNGLTRIGTVRDNVVQFQSSGQRYEIRMQDPIAGRGAWNLYGLYDPAHGAPESSTPTPATLSSSSAAVIGGTGRLENLLPK